LTSSPTVVISDLIPTHPSFSCSVFGDRSGHSGAWAGCGCRELGHLMRQCNAHRPHRSLHQRPPAGGTPPRSGAAIRPLRRDRLGDLVHEYVQGHLPQRDLQTNGAHPDTNTPHWWRPTPGADLLTSRLAAPAVPPASGGAPAAPHRCRPPPRAGEFRAQPSPPQQLVRAPRQRTSLPQQRRDRLRRNRLGPVPSSSVMPRLSLRATSRSRLSNSDLRAAACHLSARVFGR
jgi:hypothetical protein